MYVLRVSLGNHIQDVVDGHDADEVAIRVDDGQRGPVILAEHFHGVLLRVRDQEAHVVPVHEVGNASVEGGKDEFAEADVVNENIERKADGTRGFSPDRHFQHIGSVPCHVWHAHCKKIGYNQMDNASRKKEVIKFLNQFRQWSPVDSIRTEQPSEGHIVIK